MYALELQDVEKTFARRRGSAAAGLRFHLDGFIASLGQRWAFVGPSGCGKSTLLNMIAGMVSAERGTIKVNGTDLGSMPPSSRDRFRGRTMGYVFQDFNLVDALTSLENVLLGLRFGRALPRRQWPEAARAMLDRVGLADRQGHRPAQLSVGERQRVALARALVNKPPILLADEPTGSLDPATARRVFDLLLEVCDESQTTLVMVTHDSSLAGQLDERLDCSGLMVESDDAA